jgi:hypothetical protein
VSPVGSAAKRADVLSYSSTLLNPYSPEVPPDPLFAQVHEGDWELVTVILDRAGRPLTAGYSRHCSGARRAWSEVPKKGQRPVVYVALGSHANYFRPGSFRHDKRCWPEQAVIVFENYGKPVRDFTGGGRSLSPRLARVTTGSPPWMRFPGSWGRGSDHLLPAGDIHGRRRAHGCRLQADLEGPDRGAAVVAERLSNFPLDNGAMVCEIPCRQVPRIFGSAGFGISGGCLPRGHV